MSVALFKLVEYGCQDIYLRNHNTRSFWSQTYQNAGNSQPRNFLEQSYDRLYQYWYPPPYHYTKESLQNVLVTSDFIKRFGHDKLVMNIVINYYDY